MVDLTFLDPREQGANASYDFAKPFSEATASTEAVLISKLASTRAFKRLNHVRFLGALDYAIVRFPNGSKQSSRYTRAQHSLGVAKLAQRYLDQRTFTDQDRFLCIAAAMLHDIGHAPFSHTLEGIFTTKFGIDHHSASLDIISGRSPLSAGLVDILDEFSINVGSLERVLSGSDNSFDDFFSGPINFDTIEGITRCCAYFGWNRSGLTPLAIVDAATRWQTAKDFEVVDKFWLCKHDVYNLVIRSPAGVLVDRIFTEIAANSDQLEAEDFLTTEQHVFRKIPALRLIIDSDADVGTLKKLLPPTLVYEKRDFFIFQGAETTIRPSKARYRQRKSKRQLTL